MDDLVPVFNDETSTRDFLRICLGEMKKTESEVDKWTTILDD